MGSDNKPNHQTQGLPKVEKGGAIYEPFVICAVMSAIGLAIAFAIFTYGATAKYQANMAQVAAADHHWAFAAAALLGLTIRFVNFYPMVHKSDIMLRGSGNLRSNPFIYKAIGPKAAAHHVVFDDEGPVGKYNRANRSIHHMVENFGAVVAGLFLAATAFPFPVFISVCVFCVGRIWHQVGYTTGYGGHGLGFMVSMLASLAIEGMMGLVALKTLW